MAYTKISTMDAPDAIKVICLRLIREHQASFTAAQDKAAEDVAFGKTTPPPVHSPALVEMYR